MKVAAVESVTWVMCVLICGVVATDFYQLLGVEKSASVREIRKAFKKLAISAHPDKNTGDPEAHEKFLRITRAYEVLKDEELRKKYDMYGEEGLSEDNNRGRHYESWQWYQQNFGIYDEDPEIITLSKSDFEMSVDGTDDIWFINFYSPHCSHCHDLAPAWREMARELEGVIRVGAVNCEDDWALCRMQGIHSYPSLVMYPRREKYNGNRSPSALVKHAMGFISAVFHRLSKGNFKWKITEDTSGQPWLLTFCGDGGDCLEETTCLKLAAMLDGLVKVGMVDCHKYESLCDQLGHHHGIFFFKDAEEVSAKQGMEISSLVAQDIVSTVLHQLPDVTSLDQETFQNLVEGIKGDQVEAWLVHFVDSEDFHDVELRKLPTMLGGIKVGRVNCRELSAQCRALHIKKFPTFMTFKESGGAEVFYGRMTAHDVAAFAQDSVVTPLTSLDPSDFPDRVVLSRDPWFVDFFAPWCPPCMRLLPEFRKAAKRFGEKVNFGTVDCTVHGNLCSTYNIRSYPTTIFYNQTEPHQFNGQHSASALVEFIKDTLNPPVLSLSSETFHQMVRQREEGQLWLVDFFAPWCGPCRQLAPEWRQLAKMLKKNAPSVHVAQVDCTTQQALCQQESVHSYPTIRLYPVGSQGSSAYHMYNGWHRDAGSLQAWVYDYMPSKVETLDWSGFGSQVLGSQEPWLVDFYAPWCGHCQVFKPEFEKVAEKLEGKVRAGKVDCDRFQRLCNQAGVNAYPSVRFYPGADGHNRQHPYGWDIDSQNAEEIISFINRNMRKKGRDEL
ncbi:dnaJ homolog subfamily C member 10-like [Babylonia areolata]|uniref:dnaJ homolog subfamily C member 10-like n=1 Tax=Babylonia areolata TaxID=304850 RepID=UPI003FD069AD